MELATLEELSRVKHALPEPLPTEAELVEAAKRDPNALAGLYRLHHASVSRHVLRRVGQVSVAEDLVADVFLAMVRYLPKYRVGGRLLGPGFIGWRQTASTAGPAGSGGVPGGCYKTSHSTTRPRGVTRRSSRCGPRF